MHCQMDPRKTAFETTPGGKYLSLLPDLRSKPVDSACRSEGRPGPDHHRG